MDLPLSEPGSAVLCGGPFDGEFIPVTYHEIGFRGTTDPALVHWYRRVEGEVQEQGFTAHRFQFVHTVRREA